MQVKLSIFLNDNKEFNIIREEIRTLWFKTYGENLSNSSMVVKSLTYFREYLKGKKGIIEDRDADKGQDIHKYARLGF